MHATKANQPRSMYVGATIKQPDSRQDTQFRMTDMQMQLRVAARIPQRNKTPLHPEHFWQPPKQHAHCKPSREMLHQEHSTCCVQNSCSNHLQKNRQTRPSTALHHKRRVPWCMRISNSLQNNFARLLQTYCRMKWRYLCPSGSPSVAVFSSSKIEAGKHSWHTPLPRNKYEGNNAYTS